MYFKTLKYTYEQSLVKKGAPSQAFFKNCLQKKCSLSFQSTLLLPHLCFQLYCLQIYFLSVLYSVFLNKSRYFERFSKNLKYSAYPFYAAFLFLLKNISLDLIYLYVKLWIQWPSLLSQHLHLLWRFYISPRGQWNVKRELSKIMLQI